MLAYTDDDQVRALLGLCGLCGLRVSEAISVTPADFDLEKRVIHVRGKGDVERKVPFSEEAFDVLALRLAVTRERTPLVGLNDRWARKLITNVGMKALNRHISSHDLRRTFGTAVNDKYGLRVAQELLGHASVHTTELYTLVTFENLRMAVEGI